MNIFFEGYIFIFSSHLNYSSDAFIQRKYYLRKDTTKELEVEGLAQGIKNGSLVVVVFELLISHQFPSLWLPLTSL